MAALEVAGKVLGNAVTHTCILHNDLPYKISIVDFDGTHILKPGQKQENYLIAFPFVYITLVLNVDDQEGREYLYGTQYGGLVHKMSTLFRNNDIMKYINRDKDVKHIYSFMSKWVYIDNHPGGVEMERTEERALKSKLETTQTNEEKCQLDLKTIIKAIEIHPSFQAATSHSMVKTLEEESKTSIKLKFGKEPVYLWQEFIVASTSEGKIQIPTRHTRTTETATPPGNSDFLHYKEPVEV